MTSLKRVKRLPPGFVWGGATAAYQIEGSVHTDGRGDCIWDVYLKSKGNYSPEPACDFYHRYSKDIALASEIGMNALRVSISWTRLFPSGDPRQAPNAAGVSYYHKVFNCCIENNIIPYVTLHHFDSPQANYSIGDWLNPDNIDRFVGYAEFCFSEFSEVKHWFTINEPATLALDQYIFGGFPPCCHFDFLSCFQAQHNLLLAHAKTVRLYKEKGFRGKIGIVHILKPIYSFSGRTEDVHASDLFDVLYNRMLLDGTIIGEYSDKTRGLMSTILQANGLDLSFDKDDFSIMRDAASQNDFLGINYYQNMYVKAYADESVSHHNSEGKKGTLVIKLKGVGQTIKMTDIKTTDWDWNIYPKGLTDILLRVRHDYPQYPTIFITENGIGLQEKMLPKKKTISDFERIDYIDAHVDALLQARKKGVDVQGYFVWSLQDQFSWTNGYGKRYGLVFVDFNTQERYMKESARWFQELAKTVNKPVSEGAALK